MRDLPDAFHPCPAPFDSAGSTVWYRERISNRARADNPPGVVQSAVGGPDSAAQLSMVHQRTILLWLVRSFFCTGSALAAIHLPSSARACGFTSVVDCNHTYIGRGVGAHTVGP